ncbi:NaPi-T family protein [Megaselia abdita]
MSNVEARTVLWYLVFFGFAINYMIRINLNIAIVQMVVAKPKQEEFVISAGNGSNPAENFTTTVDLRGDMEEERGASFEKWLLDLFKIPYDANGFEWNEKIQGLVLGSFFWAHWITQIPGGILARKYGTKLIFGLSNAISCWLCMLMPIASYFDYKYLVFLRVAQGCIVVSIKISNKFCLIKV